MRGQRTPRAAALLAVVLFWAVAPADAVVGDDAAPRPPVAAVDASSGTYTVLLGDKPPVVTAEGLADSVALAYPRAREAAAGGPASALAAPPAALAARADAAAAVDLYSAQLRDSHTRVLAAAALPAAAGADGPYITRHFTFALNGFVAGGLSRRQADALRARPEVTAVEPVKRLRVQTYSTPEFLGLSGAGGAWSAAFNGSGNAGSSVLIGVVDTGIVSSAASFASVPRAGGRWDGAGPGSAACAEAGTCTAGKLVGCQFFEAGFNALLKKFYPQEVREPSDISTCADKSGHGSHTASTSGGNAGAPAILNGLPLSPGGMSGMAPAAAVSVYKVMWSSYNRNAGPSETYITGFDEDIVAAVEAAIKDGVDVINYSIGGDIPRYWWQSPIFEAFRNAAAAGVHVAAAAGNDGPGSETVDNGMPWITTVAAGTHARQAGADVTLTTSGGVTKVRGVSSSSRGAPASPVFWAGPSGGDAALCIANSLDESKVAGRVVFCLRGTSNRIDKSAEVKRAGGVGMVLFNVANVSDTVYTDAHSVPTVHLKLDESTKLQAAFAAAPDGATAALSGRYITQGAEAPRVAEFSSRGPSITDNALILKPDVLAPGKDIFAVASGLTGNDTGAVLSGTSMATPHITGIAALLMDKHPAWSPAAVRSALMTTASQVNNKGKAIEGTPFDFGAGAVNATAALDPGLVYDAGLPDYQIYSCAMMDRRAWKARWTKRPKLPAFCAAACSVAGATPGGGGGGAGGARARLWGAKAKAASKCAYPQAIYDLNMPSFSLPLFKPGGKGATVSAGRTVTYVGAGAATFKAELDLPSGYSGSVTVVGAGAGGALAMSFTGAGQRASFNVTITASKGVLKKTWAFGSLTWTSDGGRWTVRSPIALKRA